MPDDSRLQPLIQHPPRSPEGKPPGAFVEVWIPRRPDRPLTYAWPRDLGLPPAVGLRVVVPLKRGRYSGYVTRVWESNIPPGKFQIRPVEWVLDTRPLFDDELIQLLRWTSGYYLQSFGALIHAAVPPGLHAVHEAQVRLTRAGKEFAGKLIARSPARPPPWARILFYLAEARQAPVRRLQRVLNIRNPGAAIQYLKARGLVEVRERVQDPYRARTIRVIHPVREPEPGDRLSDRQRRLLKHIFSFHRDILADEIEDHPAYSADRLRRLERRGFIQTFTQIETRPLYWNTGETDANPTLNEDQRRVVQAILPALEPSRFMVGVLFGVTASGKTEVYLHLIEKVLAQGRTALVLLPEIGLIPSVLRRFTLRFGNDLAILHSGLSGRQRLTEWHRVRHGAARVVLGTRSAVFAPLSNLGLIIVDEEQDSSYKQSDHPVYHARDTALVRASLHRCPVLLVSATPSVETYARARADQYRLFELPRRAVTGAVLPRVTIVDMREAYRKTGDPFFSPELMEGLSAALAGGDSAILLLNRRGYATRVICRACGATASCPNCSIHMVYHRRPTRLVCHYCGHESPLPKVCSTCGETRYLSTQGLGTERVLNLVRARFENVPAARLDRDVLKKPVELFDTLAKFQQGEIRILVGTQMVAKGHHFPRVTFVGVLEADAAAGIPDFRSGERLFQLLTQVVGRAGREERPGQAVIQAYQPDYYPIRYACAQDYPGFFNEEMKYRRRYGFPPFTSLILITVRHRERERARALAEELHAALANGLPPRTTVHGPLVPFLWKLRGQYRYHILFRTRERKALREHIRTVLKTFQPSRRQVKVDIDPEQIL